LGALVDEKTLVTGGLDEVSLARLAADMIAVHGMETRPTALDKRSWCGARWTADGGEVLDQSAFGITNDTRPGRHRRTQHSSLTCYRLKMTFDLPTKDHELSFKIIFRILFRKTAERLV
jgi:hypothetical protein